MSKIIEAVLKVRKGLSVLKKEDFNPHDNYNYVSIDTYYEKIASKATEAGLLWRAIEGDLTMFEMQGRSGSRTWVRVTFTYHLYVEDETFPDYMKVTVVAPVAGAQTAGQLYSYADKVFMRNAFAVPTGEKDADDNEQDHSARRQPAPKVEAEHGTVGDLLDDFPPHELPPHDPETGELGPALPEGTLDLAPKFSAGLPLVDPKKADNEKAAKLVVEIVRTFIPMVKTTADLSDWHTENLAAFEAVAKVSPELRAEIKAMFTARNKELKAKK